MSDTRASAYADAALAIASAEGNVAEVTDELFRFGQIVQGNEELRTTLNDPHLPVEKRSQIAEDVLGGRATSTTVSFVSMLVAAGRIHVALTPQNSRATLEPLRLDGSATAAPAPGWTTPLAPLSRLVLFTDAPAALTPPSRGTLFRLRATDGTLIADTILRD
jgi:hypothetical protein